MRLFDPADDPKRAEHRPLQFFLIATLGTGAAASLFTAPALPVWYASLNRPAFAPPTFLYAPIWTALYVLMGFAAWRVWKKAGLRSPEIGLFGIQLALNFGWSVLFFGLHAIGAALLDVAAQALALLATTIVFFRRDRWAAMLMLPYLAWTVYAAWLTCVFWRLN